MFLPARSPYDRQNLIDHVAHYVGPGREVQVLVDDRRWLVQLKRGPYSGACFKCGSRAEPACHADVNQAAYCMTCALGGSGPLPVPHPPSQRVMDGMRWLTLSRATSGVE